MSRESRRKIVEENLQILGLGYYIYNDVRKNLQLSKEEREKVEVFSPKRVEEIESRNKSTLFLYDSTNIIVNDYNSFDAAYEAKSFGKNIIVLNFANAYNPGGGFLKGASAQEEVLCRQSSLYQSISSDAAKEMYIFNKARERDFTDSDYMLVSRNVEVFRKANGEYLENSFQVSVLSLPAPNLKMKASKLTSQQLKEERKRKLRKGFHVMHNERYDTIILGAWGSGAYGNDANEVARDMYEVLVDEKMVYFFKNIIFAVHDTKVERPNFNAFCNVFTEKIYIREDSSITGSGKQYDFVTAQINIENQRKDIGQSSVQNSEMEILHDTKNIKSNTIKKEIRVEDAIQNPKKGEEVLQFQFHKSDRVNMKNNIITTKIDWPTIIYDRSTPTQQDLGYIQGFVVDGRPFIAQLYDEMGADAISLNIIMSAEGFQFYDEPELANDRFRNDIEAMRWKKSILTRNLAVMYGGYGSRYEGYTNEILEYLVKYEIVRFYHASKREIVCFMTKDNNGNKIIICSVLLKSGISLKAKVGWDFMPFGQLRNDLVARYVVEMPEDGSAPTGADASVFYKTIRR